MAVLEQEGTFRGPIVDFGVNAADSGAKAVSLTVSIEDIYHEGVWVDWREYAMEVKGDIWIIKKDGLPNERQVRALAEYAGWDGSFVSLANGTWQPTPVQVQVQGDEYKGQTKFRIAWVNAYDSTPGGGGNVTPDAAKALEAQYGSQMRAIASSAKRSQAPPPAGGPTKPVAKPKTPVVVVTPKEDLPPRGEPVPTDEIPF